MKSLLARLRTLAAYEPAVLAWAASGGLAVVLAFLFHLSHTQEAAVTTIAAALATVYVAARARPVEGPAVIGALVTAVTAAAAFGLHVPVRDISVGEAVVSAVMALMFRANLTPAAAARPAYRGDHAGAAG